MADDPKLAEFRENNIKLTKEKEDLTKANGDLTKELSDLKAQLAAIDTKELTTTKATLATRDAELANEKAAHSATRQRADALVIDATLGDEFIRAGGRPDARSFIIAQAAGQFTVEGGQLKGTKFSPDNPGQPMTVSEFITLMTRQHAYCFAPSSGSGANARPGHGHGGSSSAKILKNPTPQELGRYGREIAAGTMKVVYE